MLTSATHPFIYHDVLSPGSHTCATDVAVVNRLYSKALRISAPDPPQLLLSFSAHRRRGFTHAVFTILISASPQYRIENTLRCSYHRGYLHSVSAISPQAPLPSISS